MIGPIDSMMRWWKHGGPPAMDDHVFVRPTPRVPAAEPPWLHQLDRAGIPRSLVYPTTTLGRLVDQAADRFGPHPALLYNGKRWTYAELRALVNRMAGGLAHRGVRGGDRVMLTLPNCPEFVIAFFAVQKLGAVVVNAGPLMGADDLKTILTLTSPRIVIGLDLHAGTLPTAGLHSAVEHWVWVSLQSYQPVIKRMGYQVKLWQRSHGKGAHAAAGQSNGLARGGSRGGFHGASHIAWPDLMDNAPARPPTVEPEPDHVAVLQPTGGTTGSLKVAQLSHRNLLCNAAQISLWSGCNLGQERIFAVLPMFHVYALTICLISGVYTAAEMAMMTRFETGAALDLMRSFRPTICPIVPAMCSVLCDAIEREESPAPIECLRLCISGAAPLPPELAQRFKKTTGSEIVEGYGLTEASPVTHANVPGHNRAGSIGLPMPDTSCRIADLADPTKDMPAGEPGELLIHGPQIMSGYLGNPDATSAALYEDETGRVWLRTGDIAVFDAEGFFSIVDRKKDMIIRSGLKVYPSKVEKVLRSHPQVKDVAVIDRPDPVHTSVVVAVVVPSEPLEDTQSFIDELRALCREHLAVYEVPSVVEIAESLPRSPLGKLLKRELRKMPGSPVQQTNGKEPAASITRAPRLMEEVIIKSPRVGMAPSGNGPPDANGNLFGNGKGTEDATWSL